MDVCRKDFPGRGNKGRSPASYKRRSRLSWRSEGRTVGDEVRQVEGQIREASKVMDFTLNDMRSMAGI